MDIPSHPLENPTTELLFNQLNISVLLLGSDQRVFYLNPAGERLFGISLKTAKGKEFSALVRQGKELGEWIDEVTQSGRTALIHELVLFTPRGRLEVQAEIAPLGLPDKPAGVILLLQELSTLHAFQEETRVTDRLSMMGTLASGLAHEIRNPLGGIRGAAEMLARESTSKEQNEYSSIIISEVDRLNSLITQLLDFAKPKKLKKSAININQLLSGLLDLEAAALRRGKIQIKQEFDPSLPPVWGHEGSLKQAFLNLIKNALEAMAPGGTLHLSTGFLTDYRMQGGDGKSNAVAQIKVRDTGTGISPENLNMLFTPFFTTKPRGTGLGLMMTQRILKEHEGLLKVQSEPGKGTTFRVLLKLAGPND